MSLYPRMAAALTADEELKRTLYGILNFERGAGTVVVGPLSGVLIRGVARTGVFGAGRFAGLVGFTGACMVGSAVVVVAGVTWRGIGAGRKVRGRREEEKGGGEV